VSVRRIRTAPGPATRATVARTPATHAGRTAEIDAVTLARALAQRLRSTPDASLQKLLDSVINWAVREEQGLLEPMDADKGLYRLTGKVDWVLDMILAFDEAVERQATTTPRTTSGSPPSPNAGNIA